MYIELLSQNENSEQCEAARTSTGQIILSSIQIICIRPEAAEIGDQGYSIEQLRQTLFESWDVLVHSTKVHTVNVELPWNASYPWSLDAYPSLAAHRELVVAVHNASGAVSANTHTITIQGSSWYITTYLRGPHLIEHYVNVDSILQAESNSSRWRESHPGLPHLKTLLSETLASKLLCNRSLSTQPVSNTFFIQTYDGNLKGQIETEISARARDRGIHVTFGC